MFLLDKYVSTNNSWLDIWISLFDLAIYQRRQLYLITTRYLDCAIESLCDFNKFHFVGLLNLHLSNITLQRLPLDEFNNILDFTMSIPLVDPGQMPQYMGYQMQTTVITFMVLGIVFVSLRFISRYVSGSRMGIDDILIIPAFVCCLGQGVTGLCESCAITVSLY